KDVKEVKEVKENPASCVAPSAIFAGSREVIPSPLPHLIPVYLLLPVYPLLPTLTYLYSSSISLIPPASSKTKSNILCFLTRISPNCFSCTSATACSFTISRTARNATIIAWRDGQASKN